METTTYPPSTRWQAALVHLHRRDWSDREIAEALSDLTDAAIIILTAEPLASRKQVWRLTRDTPGGGGREWTARQIQRLRQELHLPANRRNKEFRVTMAWIRKRRRRQAVEAAGWGFLLTAHPTLTAAEAAALTALAHGDDRPGIPQVRRRLLSRGLIAVTHRTAHNKPHYRSLVPGPYLPSD